MADSAGGGGSSAAAEAGPSAPLTFSLRYGGRAEVCLRAALEGLGWVEVEEEGVPVTLVFQPYTRVDWEAVLGEQGRGSTLCACYPIRTALVRKDGLAELCARLPVQCSPATTLHRRGGSREGLLAAIAPLGPPWIVKCPALNNALGVRLCASAEAVWAACTELLALHPASDLPLLVQQYIGAAASPSRGALLLHQGRYKFHARVNLLALGACAVYMHTDIVCHCASQEYAAEGSSSQPPLLHPAAHITNHVLQRQQGSYRREQHTLLLPQLLQGTPHDTPSTLRHIAALAAAVFQCALEGKVMAFEPLAAAEAAGAGAQAPSPSADTAASSAAAATATATPSAAPPPRPSLPFLPAANCFELFGADMLLLQGSEGQPLQPVLLEVNGGPALEGLALPQLCAKVCQDTVELVLGHLPGGRVQWAAPPIPAPGNGWQRIL